MAEKRRGRQLQVGSNVPVSIPDFASGSEPDPIRNPNRYISIDGALARSNGSVWSAVGVPAVGNEPTLALDFSSGDVVLTEEEFADNFRFTSDADLTAPRNLTAGTPSPQYFTVANPQGSGANDLTMVIGTSTEPVASGVESVFYADGSANGLVLLSSTSFSFDDATDTPANKTGSGGKRVVVDDPEGSLIYADDATLALDVTSGNATATVVQFIANFRYAPTAALTTARTFTFPSGRPRVFQVQNPSGSGANDLTVTIGSTSIAVPSGKERLCYTDGTTNSLVQLTDDAGSAGTFSGAWVYKNVATLQATGAFVDVSWTTEFYDDGGWWAPGAPTLFTVPTGITRVWGSCSLQFDVDANGDRQLQVLGNIAAIDSNTLIGENFVRAAAARSTGLNVAFGPVNVVAGDAIRVRTRQESGSSIDVNGGVNGDGTHFAIMGM